MSIRIISLFVFVGLSHIAVAAPDMKEGLWEVTIKMNVPNMPMEMPANTVKQCITAQDLVPKTGRQDGNCTVEHDTNGNTVAWNVECQSDSGKMQGHGKITYKNESFSGQFVSQMPNAGMGTVEMTMQMSGRYIGACQ